MKTGQKVNSLPDVQLPLQNSTNTTTKIINRGVGVLLSGSPRGILRRVLMSRDSPRSERDGIRNTRI